MALFLGGSHVSPAFGDAISVNVHNQSKTITPTKSVQTLVPDPGYTGMSQVTVQSIPSSYVTFSDTLSQFRKYISGSNWNSWYSTTEVVDSEITSIGIGKMASVYPWITTLNLPNCSAISAYGIWSNTQLTSVSLPNLKTLTGEKIFANCTLLNSINLPNLILSDTVTRATNTFESCTNLTNVEFGSGVKVITSNMFTWCTKLTSVTTDNITQIGASAFYSCKSFVTLSFPQLSSIVNPHIFYAAGIESFTDVNFPKLSFINGTAYNFLGYCSNLSIISFSNTISTASANVGSQSYIFDYFQQSLKTIYFENIYCMNSPKLFNFNNGRYSIDLVDIGFSNVNTLYSSLFSVGQWSLTSSHYINTIRLRKVNIGSNFFQYAQHIQNIELPDAINIPDYTCVNMMNLLTISIPSVKNIYTQAFFNCYLLNNVYAPICSLVGNDAFRNCSSLTNINFPLLKSISANAFYGCINLSSITMPLVSYISYSAFYGTLISSLSLDNCYSLGMSAFTGMNLLEKLYINYSSGGIFYGNVFGSSTTSLSYAYPLSIISGQCYNLSSFSGSWFDTYLPNLKTISLNCYSVNQYTFHSNTILENLYLNGISNYSNSSFGLTIGTRAFQNCTNLTNISLNNIRYIDTSAFANIKASNIYMHTASTFTYLNQYLFSGCSNLNTITISGEMSNNASFLTGTFNNISQLYSLTINLPNVIKLANTFSYTFNNTPYYSNTNYWSGPDPHIYVPASLVNAYKSAQYWSEGASYITAII